MGYAYTEWLEKENDRLRRRIAELENQLNEASWKLNPDRSGGQFTQEEIDEAKRGGHGW